MKSFCAVFIQTEHDKALQKAKLEIACNFEAKKVLSSTELA